MAKRKTVVIVSGKMGSGKDTIADYLINSYSFKKLGFADPLKQVVSDLFNVNIGNHVGSIISKDDRSILQAMGSFVRGIDPNIWVNFLIRELNETEESRIVIKDARYLNEIEAIRHHCVVRSMVFKAVRINYYPSIINHKYLKKLLSKAKLKTNFLGNSFHESEIALDSYNEWNLLIERKSGFTVQDTFSAVDKMMNQTFKDENVRSTSR